MITSIFRTLSSAGDRTPPAPPSRKTSSSCFIFVTLCGPISLILVNGVRTLRTTSEHCTRFSRPVSPGQKDPDRWSPSVCDFGRDPAQFDREWAERTAAALAVAGFAGLL